MAAILRIPLIVIVITITIHSFGQNLVTAPPPIRRPPSPAAPTHRLPPSPPPTSLQRSRQQPGIPWQQGGPSFAKVVAQTTPSPRTTPPPRFQRSSQQPAVAEARDQGEMPYAEAAQKPPSTTLPLRFETSRRSSPLPAGPRSPPTPPPRYTQPTPERRTQGEGGQPIPASARLTTGPPSSSTPSGQPKTPEDADWHLALGGRRRSLFPTARIPHIVTTSETQKQPTNYKPGKYYDPMNAGVKPRLDREDLQKQRREGTQPSYFLPPSPNDPYRMPVY